MGEKVGKILIKVSLIILLLGVLIYSGIKFYYSVIVPFDQSSIEMLQIREKVLQNSDSFLKIVLMMYFLGTAFGLWQIEENVFLAKIKKILILCFATIGLEILCVLPFCLIDRQLTADYMLPVLNTVFNIPLMFVIIFMVKRFRRKLTDLWS